jgi:uncharacterized protein YprB with RNaseH-like and TPR domain
VTDSEELRRRLEAKKHERPGEGAGREGEQQEIRRAVRGMRERGSERRMRPLYYRRNLPQHEPTRPAAQAGGKPVALEEAAGGVEVEAPDGSRAWFVAERLSALGPEFRETGEEFERALTATGSSLRQRLKAAVGAGDVNVQQIVFLDLETTGLSNCPVFLIGTMQWAGDEFEVRQYFARNYAEERAILHLYNEAAADKRLLVTFNGKSFDMPFVRMRAVVNAAPAPPEPAHFDLLHECRRIWGRALPNCRLQTLESRICGRARTGDIPGAEIPAAYHDYVRTGDAWQMVEVLRHNMLDLVTMADLMVRFPAPE